MLTNKEKQESLIKWGVLEPPADGKWGKMSEGSLTKFKELYNLSSSSESQIESKLLENPKPIDLSKNDFAAKIIKYMISKNYHISVGSKLYNIVYVEGCDEDGKCNDDKFNEWNDRRIVIEIYGSDRVPRIVGNWLATTEPGRKYTVNPMNPQGAFRIEFGQYIGCWQVGIHKDHEALVQTGKVKGRRDKNKDGMRTGDPLVEGLYGVNQHWGYDMKMVEGASAGCLVGQSKEGHREFMRLIKTDYRYLINKGYCFSATVIPGNEL